MQAVDHSAVRFLEWNSKQSLLGGLFTRNETQECRSGYKQLQSDQTLQPSYSCTGCGVSSVSHRKAVTIAFNFLLSAIFFYTNYTSVRAFWKSFVLPCRQPCAHGVRGLHVCEFKVTQSSITDLLYRWFSADQRVKPDFFMKQLQDGWILLVSFWHSHREGELGPHYRHNCCRYDLMWKKTVL